MYFKFFMCSVQWYLWLKIFLSNNLDRHLFTCPAFERSSALKEQHVHSVKYVTTGSFCHLTAEFPKPVVKAFLGDPTPPAKFQFCQSAVAAFLNKHCPWLHPTVVPRCQYFCHLIASLPPSRKTHRAFFKFWDIISHCWVRCHAGGYCALTEKQRSRGFRRGFFV